MVSGFQLKKVAKMDIIIVSGTRRDEFDDFEMPIWFSTSSSAKANTFSYYVSVMLASQTQAMLLC